MANRPIELAWLLLGVSPISSSSSSPPPPPPQPAQPASRPRGFAPAPRPPLSAIRRSRTLPPRPSAPPGLLAIATSPPQQEVASSMEDLEDVRGLTASVGELRVEAASSSKDSEVSRSGNTVDHGVVADDDIWDDDSDSPGHRYTLDREWVHRQNQFEKMGYRDGVAEGQKDIAQEGFNVGFGQSVDVGYKWGLVRGITSVLASLPDSLKEKLLPNVQCRGQLQDLNNSVQEISSEDALLMFHESILQNSHSSEEPHVTLRRATDSSRLQSLSKDLVLLLHECPDMNVSEELTKDS